MRVPRFGKYELTTRIAKGGMGETYLAELNAVAGVTKRVVIKKMLPQLSADEQLVEAFINEARISATLSHGNIAQVFDFGSIEGEYFLAMEYVHGHSLQGVMKRAPAAGYRTLPHAVAAYIGIELLKALHYAHTRTGPNGVPLNLVHRDVTPDNILVSFEGEVKLVDFGVAKAQLKGRTETEPGLVKGKFRYLSPEQALAAPIDARSDIFAVGIVLYELLSGEPLFTGQMHQVMNAIVRQPVPPLLARAPEVPEPLAEVVHTALSRGAADRYPTALAMQEALSRWLFTRTPDFTGDVLRELMGELFAAELAKAGTPFVAKKKATGMLRALKVETATPPAVSEVPTTPGRRAVNPVSTTQPSARLPRGTLYAGVALLVVLGAAVLASVLPGSAEPASEEACLKAAEQALELGAHGEVARAIVNGCLGDRAPGGRAQALLSVIDACSEQLGRVLDANRAMDRGDLDEAEEHLAIGQGLPCSARQRQAAGRRLATLRPAGLQTEESCLADGQRDLEAGSPASAVRAAVLTCLGNRTPSPVARGELSRYARCEAELARLAGVERAIAEGRLDEAYAELSLNPMSCATARHAALTAALTEARAKPRAVEPTARSSASADALLEEARAHNKSKEYGKARGMLEKCIKLEPKNAECWKLLGVVYTGLGDGAQGAKAYEKFLQLAPEHPQADKVRHILEAYRGNGSWR